MLERFLDEDIFLNRVEGRLISYNNLETFAVR